MFARRIAIVSLMTVLFGLLTARLVAETDRNRAMRDGSVASCITDLGYVACGVGRGQ